MNQGFIPFYGQIIFHLGHTGSPYSAPHVATYHIPPPVLTYLVCGEADQDMESSRRRRNTTKAARLTQKAMTIESVGGGHASPRQRDVTEPTGGKRGPPCAVGMGLWGLSVLGCDGRQRYGGRCFH